MIRNDQNDLLPTSNRQSSIPRSTRVRSLRHGGSPIWFGGKVSKHDGTLPELGRELPIFERIPFRVGRSINPHLDVIVLPPWKRQRVIPVATVSKAYELVQHTEVLDAVGEALAIRQERMSGVKAKMLLSEYCERMYLSIPLPAYDFDPGDKYPLQLQVACFNSVDKSMALEVSLIYERLVCSNGLVVFDTLDSARHIHLAGRIEASDVKKFLDDRLPILETQQNGYRELLNKPLEMSQVEQWADGDLTKAWGIHAAARTCHIAKTGMDGEVEPPPPRSKLPAHSRSIRETQPVPGACAPVNNVYHLCQTLSWIAHHRNSVQDQLESMWQIPNLVKPLLN